VCCVLTVISVFVRLHSAEGEERQQIKWFAYAAVVLLCSFFVGLPVAAMREAVGVPWAGFLLIIINLLGTPMTIGVSILKYRLYAIDLLINIRGTHRVSS